MILNEKKIAAESCKSSRVPRMVQRRIFWEEALDMDIHRPPAPLQGSTSLQYQSTQTFVAAIHPAHICWTPTFYQAVYAALEDKMEKKT